MHSLKTTVMLLLLSLGLMAQEPTATKTIVDADLCPPGQSLVTFSADTVYFLDGFVFVEDGCTLRVEAGTIIKGVNLPTTGDFASALIIARGGRIEAEGRPDAPIIFTSEFDDTADPNDLSCADNGTWGGVIVLGRASNNFDDGVTPGVNSIEGLPLGDPRALYGAAPGSANDNDDSGIIRYVSIRHGGAELSPANEINGLTLGSIGAGTTIEFVEVYANLDDSFEWFGGTVNTRYLVAAYSADDQYDWDEGFRGKHQFWVAISSNPCGGGRMAEQDGGTTPETGTPFSQPIISNATYVGPGPAGTTPPAGDGGQMLVFRDNSGGHYLNSIFCEYVGAGGSVAVTIEDLVGTSSRDRLDAGELSLVNNIWHGFGAGSTSTDIWPQAFVETALLAAGNSIADPLLSSIDRTAVNALDLRPGAGSPAIGGADFSSSLLQDNYFYDVTYQGAFDPSKPAWTNGWTALWAENHSPQTGASASVDQSLAAGFDLVSFAAQPLGDASLGGNFPSVTAPAFAFSGVYSAVASGDDLAFGTGYWMNSPSAGTSTLNPVAPIFSVDLSLSAGFNLIGGTSCPVDVADIVDAGGIIVPGTIFGFSGTYFSATTIDPGKAYWINASSAGTITLQPGTVVPGPSAPVISLDTYSGLEISDAKGVTQTLYLGVEAVNANKVSYTFPPVPPAGVFDARFVDNSRASELEEGVVRIQASELPISIKANDGSSYVIEVMQADGKGEVLELNAGPVTITNAGVTHIKVSKSGNGNDAVAAVPNTLVVEQNYPNPFNPTTAIRYALPVNADVQVVVYNSLGQKVRTLVSSFQEAGNYELVWDASDDFGAAVGTGVYYYSVKAADFQSIKKMVLLK